MKFPKIISRRARSVLLGLAAVAACLLIAACGGSSGTSGATSSNSAASGNGSTSASRTAFVKCLKEHGLTPPARTSGSGTPRTRTGPPPAGFGAGGGNPTRQAAFKACGAPGQRQPAP
ncbi:MAG: hypothetical protein E6G62_06435 [Actinobacteria bacterium]|nr:MAG: hypothetical protein E6G62_06435 [Actinomycetota bacterium]